MRTLTLNPAGSIALVTGALEARARRFVLGYAGRQMAELWMWKEWNNGRELTADTDKVPINPDCGFGWRPVGTASASNSLCIGLCEVAGAIGLWLQRFSFSAKICFIILMAGAVLTHLVFDTFKEAMAPIILMILTAAALALHRKDGGTNDDLMPAG